MDQMSLFIAAGICAFALAMAMLSAWAQNRRDGFLLGWMLALLLLGGGVVLYHVFPPDRPGIVALAFAMEIGGFVVVLAAARGFAGHATPPGLWLALSAAVPLVAVPILLGRDGIGIMIYNFLSGCLLTATAVQYWHARREAPSSMAALAALYALTAISFHACAVMIAGDRAWMLDGRPDNWAESFNAMMCLAGITGIGALSLGLNNARAARRHRLEAQTDMLTGLLNRRALCERMAGGPPASGLAVIVFDLDHFKAVNDRHGHAAGDEVLRRFAGVLRQNMRPGDIAARTGGEEFVLVLGDASPMLAAATAERVRALFAESRIDTAGGPVRATASAGLALAGSGTESFGELLNRADISLYRAKSGGRNRVMSEPGHHELRAAG